VTFSALLLAFALPLPEKLFPYHKELRAVDNRVIRWDHQFIGLIPFVDKKILEKYQKFTDDPRFYQALYDLLSDEKRFAIAHVMLTFYVERAPIVDRGGKIIDHWYGLVVSGEPNEMYPNPQRQMRFLRAYWKRVLRENKLLP